MRIVVVGALVALVACADEHAVAGGTDVPQPAPPALAAPAQPAIDPADDVERWVEIGRFGDERFAERRVMAYLPREYAPAPDGRFPVLYLLDGLGAFALFELGPAIDELTERETILPWIVVTIDSTLARNEELSRDADAFARFVADEIAPAVDAALRTRTDADGTAIAGYSYGGLTAVRAQLERPERFGRVVAMSPSLWHARGRTLRDFRGASAPVPTRMWIDIGSREGRPGETVPYMVADARALRDVALERGMRFGASLGYLEAFGESHDMRAAARRIREALAFALSDRDLATIRAPR